ncbi:MAG TPA: LamG-like jellyroll fold domain-containing protein, partial [Methylomirabilota bacterium]|nr:LamG-like jellyroll fold domain-containing protein [Methylomirabilota bacterium]
MKRMKFVWHALTSSVVAWMGTVTIAGPVLPPWPEGALKHWRFNAAAEFASERTAPLDHAGVLSVESWSGWALQVAGASPAVIRFPGRDATGRPNLTLDQGSVRFWFRPDWNSGAGPGVAAPLFEVAAVSGRLWSGWSLEVSADGSRLGLVVQGNAVGEEWLLETPIGWLAGRWHEVVVSYAAEATALYVDGLLVARGEGLRLGSVTVGDADVGFSLGSDVASGTRLAQGQFEELSTYDYVYPAEGVAR